MEAGGDYGKCDAPNWWFYDEKELSRHLRPGRLCFSRTGRNELNDPFRGKAEVIGEQCSKSLFFRIFDLYDNRAIRHRYFHLRRTISAQKCRPKIIMGINLIFCQKRFALVQFNRHMRGHPQIRSAFRAELDAVHVSGRLKMRTSAESHCHCRTDRTYKRSLLIKYGLARNIAQIESQFEIRIIVFC